MNYTGLGVYQQPPPKRPGRAPLWIALAAVAVLVVGGGVTALVRAKSGDAGAPRATPAPTSAPEPDWQPVDDPQAGLAYELPPSWESSGSGASGRVRMTTSYVSRPFECQGRSMVQAQAMAGSVVDDDPEQVATELVNRIAAGGYTVDDAPPRIDEPRVEPSDDGAVRLSVEVTPQAANACFAPRAAVSAVALRRGAEVAVLVLNVARGGPHVAEGPSEDDVERILRSVRLS
ncbi:hypothetical protein ACIGNX_20480 [Actinosynnema sp. NPDC053489]|uniref:hypothetical protein n=1 Tax=Actinosynnema sp. NPDC053489 TaxID=3363916 RepID=UPI0037CA605C